MKHSKNQLLLVAAIMFVAASLRAPITAVGPLVGSIRESFPLPSGVLGLLTTIPLIMFAAVSLFVCGISNRLGAGRTVLASLLVICAGIALRSFAGVAGLFIGTVLVGLGLAFGNVLVPGIVKARFPERVGPLTSVFTIAMSSFAALSSAVSYPLSRFAFFDWRLSLAAWLVLVAAAAAVWWPQRGLSLSPAACETGCAALSATAIKERSVFRSGTAWWLTLLMGAQSYLFYFFTAWLPTMLQAKGFSASGAGYVSFAFQLMTMPASLIVPALAVRLRNQKALTTVVAALYAGTIALFYFARSNALLTAAAMLCGLCNGSCFSLCMLLIGLRTNSAERATSLSGMVQSLGYAIGAVGPFAAGALFDATGSWSAAMLCAGALTLVILFAGRRAGENRRV